ncbi:MAG: hypothetical protein HOV71_12280 [Hamadaea sp.]|nr:hypothetical protein [Hamadaea sp.]NUT05210.1 hypothetical protein [Hamadaea sp.]
MRTRTRVALLAAGVALAGVAVASAVPDDAPVATLSPAPVASSTGDGPASEATSTSGSSTTADQRSQTPPNGSTSIGAGIRELRTAGNGKNSVLVSPAGTVTAATAEAGKVLTTAGADAFTTRYAAAFGLTAAHSLSKPQTTTLPGGDTISRYQQTAGGLPVLGGQIVVTSHGKRVQSAIAETSSLSPVATKAAVPAATAAATAVASTAEKVGLDATTLRAGTPELALYDPAVLGAPGAAGLRPTWQVGVRDRDGGDVATVLVDALDGQTRLTMSERQSARNRVICDLANTAVNVDVAANYACTTTSPLGLQSTTRKEGGVASTVAEVNKAYDLLGAIHSFYQDSFGVDSFDGRGAQIRATVRACYKYLVRQYCPYENAFWDGSQFVFGTGFVVDDVTAHEYTHAITEYSSHLYYAYQAGAINEALSDIMGELFDQQYATAQDDPAKAWWLGEDLTASSTLPVPLRRMDDPTAIPDVGYRQPATLGGQYWYNGDDDNGGVHINSGVANKAAYLIATGTNGLTNRQSAQLWWRVMHVLPSGADYTVLAAALRSSCTQLIGKFGITPANCGAVDAAIAQTNMAGAQTLAGTGVTHLPLCPSSATQPIDTAYFDGFESAGGWLLSNTNYWEYIPAGLPAGYAPYQYAASGTSSLNTWASGPTGNGATATMPVAVTVPANAYLRFAQSTLSRSTGAATVLEVSINNGAWQAPPAALGYTGLTQTRGYSDIRLNLTSLAGKTVKFRFRLSSASNADYYDWYVDDFHIYGCANRPSAPKGYAYYEGTTAVVGGLSMAGGFLPAGTTLDHYELAYSSGMRGAPTMLASSANGFSVAADGRTRTVKVRAVTTTGVAGDWLVLLLTQSAPTACQRSAYPPATGTTEACLRDTLSRWRGAPPTLGDGTR